MYGDYLKVYLEKEKYLKECIKQIEKIGSNISNNDNSIEAMQSINTMYKYLKKVADKFYDKDTGIMHNLYNNLIWKVYDSRNKINSSYYIIPTNEFYKYNKNFYFENDINGLDEIQKLNFIVHETYNIYQKECIHFYPKNFERLDLINSCYKISEIVKQLCDSYHIDCQLIKIDSGFSNKTPLFNGDRFHYFNIVQFDNNQYLIDCSYKQFFLANRNMIESLGIPNFTTPLAGCYMIMNEERCKVAKKILKFGYILITPENLKHYLDGFTLSFRNGLYYEENINATYTTPYTYNQYLEFLYTDASLLDYENIEQLGYQKRPLKNSKFIFKQK